MPRKFLPVSAVLRAKVALLSIVSYLPPSTTLRRNLRMTYATTVQQLGQAYCDVVSNATLRDEAMDTELIKDLIAIRMKLNRAKGLMTNVPYELSLRGKWPKERYVTVHEIQMFVVHKVFCRSLADIRCRIQGIGLSTESSTFSYPTSRKVMVPSVLETHAIPRTRLPGRYPCRY